MRRVFTLCVILLLYGCGWERTVDHTRCGNIGSKLTTPTEAPKANEINVIVLSAGESPWHDSIDDLPKPDTIDRKHPCEK